MVRFKAKWLYSGKCSCVCPKTLLLSGKVVVVGQSTTSISEIGGFISAQIQVVVFEYNRCCISAKTSVCPVGQPLVVFGQYSHLCSGYSGYICPDTTTLYVLQPLFNRGTTTLPEYNQVVPVFGQL